MAWDISRFVIQSTPMAVCQSVLLCRAPSRLERPPLWPFTWITRPWPAWSHPGCLIQGEGQHIAPDESERVMRLGADVHPGHVITGPVVAHGRPARPATQVQTPGPHL